MKRTVLLKELFIFTLLLCSLLALFACKQVSIPEVTFYVSPSGADTNEGSEISPFLTIEKAIDAVNLYESSNTESCNYYIKILGKIYIDENIELNENTLKTNNNSLTIEGINGTVSGGLDIPIDDFSALKEQPTHLKNDVLENIVSVNLNDYGITQYSEIANVGFSEEFEIPPIELFYNGSALPIARYPNAGYIKAIDASNSEYAAGIKTNIPSSLLTSWDSQGGGYMSGFFYHDWADDTVSIDHIDPILGTLDSNTETSYGERADARYYIFNYISELDSIGEWYLDRSNGELYVYLPEDATGSITLSLLDTTLFNISNINNIKFSELTFEGSRSDLINIDNCNSITINDSLMRYVGRRALIVDNSKDFVISGCEIYETGITAIELRDNDDDRATLTPSGNIIKNCTITRNSRNVKAMGSIWVKGVGITVTGCKIFNAPHTAIYFSGNDNTISFNDISNVCYLTADSGAIYSGRNYTYGGNVVEYNHISDMNANCDGTLGASDMGLGTCAVYLDDLVSGITVRNNLFTNVYRGILLGGGKNNTITDNLFASTTILISADSRGETWESYHVPNNPLEVRLFDTDLNIRDSELWLTRFPYLAELIEQYDSGDTAGIYAPSNNLISGNITTGTMLELIDSSVKVHGEYHKPVYFSPEFVFVDFENGNYTIREEAIASGIPDIRFNEIGKP